MWKIYSVPCDSALNKFSCIHVHIYIFPSILDTFQYNKGVRDRGGPQICDTSCFLFATKSAEMAVSLSALRARRLAFLYPQKNFGQSFLLDTESTLGP
jgi:hypothetical protein